jgi:hypothetical protein
VLKSSSRMIPWSDQSDGGDEPTVMRPMIIIASLALS